MWVRFAASLLALGAGIAAIVVAIVLLNQTLG